MISVSGRSLLGEEGGGFGVGVFGRAFAAGQSQVSVRALQDVATAVGDQQTPRDQIAQVQIEISRKAAKTQG